MWPNLQYHSQYLVCMVVMKMMMINCFCGMVDQWNGLSLISSRDHCQKSSPSRISDTPRARFETTQNLSSGLVKWSCAVVITNTQRRHKILALWISPNILINVVGWIQCQRFDLPCSKVTLILKFIINVISIGFFFNFSATLLIIWYVLCMSR